jgi:hypothetical protein
MMGGRKLPGPLVAMRHTRHMGPVEQGQARQELCEKFAKSRSSPSPGMLCTGHTPHTKRQAIGGLKRGTAVDDRTKVDVH